MLKERVLSAVILIPLIFVAIYLGGYVYVAAIVFVGVVALFEGYRMTGVITFWPLFYLGVLLEVVLMLAGPGQPLSPWLGDFLAAGIVLSLTVALFNKVKQPATKWAWALALAIYLGWLLHYFIVLRALPRGLWWAIFGLLITWITDSGAYFVGIRLGKHKLWPRLSPKKTWEGAIGGWITGVLGTLLLGEILLPGISWEQWLLLGAIVSFVAPFGDLSVSMLKREIGVKDSGRLIPGHGGMLDRLDSLLFVVPVLFYFAQLWT